MDQLDLFHIKGGAVTARLIRGQALISICAVVTVSWGCNGAFAYVYFCALGVMRTAFGQSRSPLVLIYWERAFCKPGDFRQQNSSCFHTVQLRFDSDTLWASSEPLGVGEYTQ